MEFVGPPGAALLGHIAWLSEDMHAVALKGNALQILISQAHVGEVCESSRAGVPCGFSICPPWTRGVVGGRKAKAQSKRGANFKVGAGCRRGEVLADQGGHESENAFDAADGVAPSGEDVAQQTDAVAFGNQLIPRLASGACAWF